MTHQGKSISGMKTVLITGASGALGTEVCRTFLEAGYKVIAIIYNHQVSIQKKYSKTMFSFKVDLTQKAAVEKTFKTIKKEHKKIDAGIFLAGGFEAGNFEATDGELLRRMITLNFESAFYISEKLYTEMKRQGGGKMVFIGARPALESKSATGAIAYALSKSLVVKLSELYNASGSKSGITTAAFIPSVIDTPSNRKNMPDADFSKWVDPRDIAQNILFFCSANGEILRESVFKVYGDA